MTTKHNITEPILGDITRGFLLSLVSLFVLFTGFSGYEGITEAKYGLFLLLCGGYVFVMAVVSIDRTILKGTGFRIKDAVRSSTIAQRFAIAYMLLTWVSALLSTHFPETIIGASRYEGALTTSIYVLCFLFVSTYGEIDRTLIAAITAGVAIFDVLSITQMCGYNPFSLYPKGYDYFDAYTSYGGEFLGTIGNVDLVAAFLCLTIPLLLGTVILGAGKKRYALLVPLILSALVLIKMNVLAGLVGVTIGLLLSLPVILPMGSRGKRTFWICIGALGILGLATLYLLDMGTGMFHEIHEVLHGNADEHFGSGRLYIWQSVIERIPNNTFFGTGPDTMIYSGIEAFSRYDETLGAMIVSQIDVAHNEYLNVLYHQGIFAFFAYTGLLSTLAIRWVKGSGDNIRVAVLGSMILSYSIQAFFGFSMCITAPLFWVTLGLLDKESSRVEQGPHPAVFTTRRFVEPTT